MPDVLTPLPCAVQVRAMAGVPAGTPWPMKIQSQVGGGTGEFLRPRLALLAQLTFHSPLPPFPNAPVVCLKTVMLHGLSFPFYHFACRLSLFLVCVFVCVSVCVPFREHD